MKQRERLIATGYLMARHWIRGTDPPYDPVAFPFERLPLYRAEGLPRAQLAVVVAAYAHYVTEAGDVAAVRVRQMQTLDRELSKRVAS